MTIKLLNQLNSLSKAHDISVKNYIRDKDPEKGYLSHMVGLLGSKDPLVRKKISEYFVHFFHNNSKNKAYLRQTQGNGVFDIFITLLVDTSAVCIVNGLRVIKSLALDIDNQSLLYNSIPILISLCHTPFVSTRRLALSALWAVCYDTPRNRLAIGAPGDSPSGSTAASGIETLIQILRGQSQTQAHTHTPVDGECMRSAAGVCMRLAIEAGNESEFQRNDAICVFVSILRHNTSTTSTNNNTSNTSTNSNNVESTTIGKYNIESCTYIMGCLWLLVYDSDVNRMSLFNCSGGVQCLLDSLVANSSNVTEYRAHSARYIQYIICHCVSLYVIVCEYN